MPQWDLQLNGGRVVRGAVGTGGNCPGGNCLRGSCPGGNLHRGQLPRGDCLGDDWHGEQLSGRMVLGAISWGVIVQGAIVKGGIVLELSRRNGILIHGIDEDKDEVNDDIVVNMLQDKLELEILKKDIDRSHSIGKPSPKDKRTIIMKFIWYNDGH